MNSKMSPSARLSPSPDRRTLPFLMAVVLSLALALAVTPPVQAREVVPTSTTSTATISADRTLLDGAHPSTTIRVTCTANEVVVLYQYRSEAEGGSRAYGSNTVQCTGSQQVLATDLRVTEPAGSMTFFAAKPLINFDYERLSDDLTISWEPWVIDGVHFSPLTSTTGMVGVRLNKPLDDTQTYLRVYVKRPGASTPSTVLSCNAGSSCFIKSVSYASLADPANEWTYVLDSSQGETPPRALNPFSTPVSPDFFEVCGGECSDSNQNVGYVADPISTLDGTYFETFTDLSMASRGPALGFARTYTSGRASQNGPLGFGWSFSYDWRALRSSDGLSVTVHDGQGNRTSFIKSGSDWIGPEHVNQRLAESGGVLSLYRKNSRETLTFAADGSLSTLVDHNGETLQMTHSSGRLVSVQGQSTQKLTFGWTGSRITSVTDHTGRTITLGYSTSGDLTSATLLDGMSWTYTYDTAHRLLTKVDGRGATTTNTYDATSGRVASQVSPQGGTTAFTYVIAGDLTTTTVTDPAGVKTRWFYAYRSLSAKTERMNTTSELVTSYVYDPISLLPLAVLSGDRKATMRYDARGNLTAHHVEGGTSTSLTYTPDDLLASATDALGFQSTFTYTAQGNVDTASIPSANGQVLTTTFTRSSVHPGDVLSTTTPAGVSHLTYDAFGNLAQATDRSGRRVASQADSLGRPLKVTREAGLLTSTANDHAVRMTSDDAGRVTSRTDALGAVASIDYDLSGNPTLATDEAGHPSTTAYNLAGLPTSTTTGSKVTSTTYDLAGRVTEQVDGKGKITAFAYRSDGLLDTITDPLGRVTRWTTYNKYGEPTRVTQPDGDRVDLTYDPAGRVTQKRLTPASGSGRVGGTTEWAYDEIGRMVSMTDAAGLTDYFYDSASNLISVDAPGVVADVAYGYDINGRQTSVVYPGAKTLTREFDPDGRMTKVRDWSAREHLFDYDVNGDSLRHTLPGAAVKTTFARDALDRVSGIATKVSGVEVAAFTYAYDARSKLSGIATSGQAQTGDPGQSLAFDAGGRVTASGAGATAWDAANQPTSLPGQSGRTHDDAGQLTSATIAGVPTTFAHSTSGARTSRATATETTTYGYDTEDHLSTFSKAGVSTTYGYDGNGLRRTKKVGTDATETFTWDLSTGLPLLLADATNLYVYGPHGQIIQQTAKSGGATAYPTLDITGSVRLLMSASGAILGQKSYSQSGKETSTGLPTPFGFSGEYTDQESGLIYLRARHYDPSTATFLTVDPLLHLTRDAYGYADGDPYLNSDPSGLMPLLAVAALTGGVWGGATALIDGIAAGESGWKLAGRVGIGAVGGAVGASCYVFAGVAMAAGCGSGVAMTTNAATSALATGSVNMNEMFAAGVMGGAMSRLPLYSLNKQMKTLYPSGGNALQRATASSRTRSMIHDPWSNLGRGNGGICVCYVIHKLFDSSWSQDDERG